MDIVSTNFLGIVMVIPKILVVWAVVNLEFISKSFPQISIHPQSLTCLQIRFFLFVHSIHRPLLNVVHVHISLQTAQ